MITLQKVNQNKLWKQILNQLNVEKWKKKIKKYSSQLRLTYQTCNSNFMRRCIVKIDVLGLRQQHLGGELGVPPIISNNENNHTTHI
jgi:hypothetical protein